MKKVLAMLLCIFLIATLSTGVLADEAEMVPVMAQVPADWQGVCCWAWADDGTNAFSAWPGGAMEPLGESGWVYIYVPSFVQNVILSANEATVQTAGDVVEAGKAVWISVADDLTTTVSYDAQADVEIPAYVETYTVHAYVPLEWETVAVQGTAMTGGEDGWFTAQVPLTETSLVLSGNDGAAQTDAITVEPQEVWITVYNDLTTEVVYEDPEAPQAEPITVYAQVPDDWAAPCCWAWSAPDGTNAFSAWPGEAMTQGEDGWYALEVPGWVNSIIINANEGSIQTTDISVEVGKDLWITVTDAENAAVSYEAPAADAEAPTDAEPPAEDVSEPETPEEPAPVEETGSSSAAIWIVAAVAVVAVVVIAVVVSKKKKK